MSKKARRVSITIKDRHLRCYQTTSIEDYHRDCRFHTNKQNADINELARLHILYNSYMSFVNLKKN